MTSAQHKRFRLESVNRPNGLIPIDVSDRKASPYRPKGAARDLIAIAIYLHLDSEFSKPPNLPIFFLLKGVANLCCKVRTHRFLPIIIQIQTTSFVERYLLLLCTLFTLGPQCFKLYLWRYKYSYVTLL
jgi:hypothetical protein